MKVKQILETDILKVVNNEMSYQDIPSTRTKTHLANGETKLFDLNDLLEFKNSKGALN
jgi:hypothetical protein